MKTETKFVGRVSFNHRVGWVVIWNDDYKSAMPDEATAIRCAAAPEMFDALQTFMDATALDTPAKVEAARVKTQSILSKLTCK